MCGIAGLLAPAGLGDGELPHLAQAMADRLAHRGPDDQGTWIDHEVGVGLAHRRLSIVGLGPVGHQPMVSASGRWVLTYNGEVYNAERLGRRLSDAGHRFRGTSDTEVLVEAIDEWGVEGALREANGMFAFAAWDRRERRLVLARDRIGEKPLLYGRIGGAFAFASELRALDVLPGASRELDPDAVALLLRFKYVPSPWSIVRGIRKLPPGHLLEVGLDDRDLPEPRPYWSFSEVAESGARDLLPDTTETLDLLDAAIGRAVGARLRSDVPIGAFLSGGIDSATVASHAAEQSTDPLRTFTIASDDHDHDESGPARVIAERLGADHTELLVTGKEALELVPDIAGVYDEPFADSSQVPTYLVSRLARTDVTVALSGDGGDEVFGGYNRHVWLPRVWRRLGAVPQRPRQVAARLLAMPGPPTWQRIGNLVPASRRPRLLDLKAEKLASVVGLADAPAAYARLVSHWDDPGLVVRGAVEPQTLTHRPQDWPDLPSLLTQMMAVDAQTYLPDDVLVKVDRASMAVGLEARVPLLDPDLIALATRLPPEVLVKDGKGKWPLRQLLLRRHPAEVIERPKSGFGLPIGQWLRGPLRPWAEDLLAEASLARDGLLDPGPVRALWAAHLAGERDGSYELWDVLMLQSWREHRDGA